MRDAVKDKWIIQALGFHVPPPPGIADLLPIWRNAKDEVDAGIERLRRALRDTEDEDLAVIADLGLGGLSGGESVALMVALREGARDKLRDASVAFRKFLTKDEAVELIDENPFGVIVDARAKLGRALNQIDAALAA